MTGYWDQMFNLGGTAVTTLTAMNPGTTSAAGSYSPKSNGTLQKIDIIVTPQAASSLAENGYITLTCTSWTPVNTLTISFSGFGLATAPAFTSGSLMHQWFPPVGDGTLALPVTTAVPILGSVIYFFSPVTPSIQVLGLFSA